MDAQLNSQFEIHIEFEPKFNYSHFQNKVPFIHSLRIQNVTELTFEQFEIKISAEPCAFEPFSAIYTSIAPDQQIVLENPGIQFSPAYLKELREREAGLIIIHLIYEGSVILKKQYDFELYAFNEWCGISSLPEILAAFCTPNQESISNIIRSSRDHLKQLTGDTSFSGYQTNSKDYIAHRCHAIYNQLCDQSISYINPPASFETTGQKIRFPDEIELHSMGTCLDLTLLFCACLEQVGLYPLIIMVEGHSFAGLHLAPLPYNDCIIEEPTRLRNRIDAGDMIAFETTGITQANSPLSFTSACSLGRRKLDDNDKFLFAIDVKAARNRQIRPLAISLKRANSDTPVSNEQAVISTESVVVETPSSIHQDSDIQTTSQRQTPVPQEPVDIPSRIKKWKDKLLDLTMRNRLLNFKESKKTVALLKIDLHKLKDALAAGISFELCPYERIPFQSDNRDSSLFLTETGNDPIDDFVLNELSNQHLYSKLRKDSFDKNLTEISREYKNNIQEGGANTLFLAMGFLSWYESPSSQDRKLAPIILLPLNIKRKSINAPFTLSLIDEEPRINVTLLKKLESDFGILVDSLDPLPLDDSGLDLLHIFNTMRKAIDHQKRWEIIEESQIGHFSFSKYLLWYELENNLDQMLMNPVIKHLIDPNAGKFNDGVPYPDHNEVDEKYTPKDVFCVTDADSSQMAAIIAAADGKSFVLEGPPGTGKSQTITNIIAHCIAKGKRVLFVSAKMAALDVVHDRLCKAGLGPFCLELHSNKYSVRYMLDQCKEALEASIIDGEYAEQDWKQHAESLQSIRDELNAHAALLRSPQPYERTTFQVFSKAIGYSQYPRVKPDWTKPETIDAEFYKHALDSIERLAANARSVDGIHTNAWADCLITTWSFDIEKQCIEFISTVKQTAQSCVNALKECSKHFLIDDEQWSLSQVNGMASAASALLNSGSFNKQMLQNPQWAQSKQTLDKLVETGQQRDEFRNQIREVLTDAIFELDVKPIRELYVKAESSGFFGSFWNQWKAAKALKQYYAKKTKKQRNEWIELLDHVAAVQDLNKNLSSLQTEAQDAIGDNWNHQDANWNKLNDNILQTNTINNALNAFQNDNFERKERWIQIATDGRDQIQPTTPIGKTLAELIDHHRLLNQQLEQLAKLLSFDAETFWGKPDSAGYLEAILNSCESWSSKVSDLKDWSYFNEVCDEVIDIGFGELIRQLRSGDLEIDSVHNVFNHSFYRWSAERIFEKEEKLKRFQSSEHARKIERFKESDQQLQHKTKKYIAGKLIDKIPNTGNVHADSEPGKLKRYIEQQRPRVSIRKLIRESGNTLIRIKPCFLMSPLSIVQYLDFEYPPFDLVLFDEASQLPVWDAVSALARAKQAIVVGDRKQLPPTNFFAKSNSDDGFEDEDEIVEQESLLDEFIVNFPDETLRVHYRSRHEDLITFSNRKYYHNKLITFPSVSFHHPTLGVSMRYFDDAVYDRGSTRTNRREADAIVEEIVKRLSDEKMKQHTIGVVTLNSTQQRLIEDLLDKARRDHPEIDPYFLDDCSEPVIVKNLENVQGDERDVILLSITYGPDAQGRFYQTFGPIGQIGGERRLNVAITRARRQVVVFASIHSDKISAGGKQGRQDLKTYLDYAERGPDAIPAESVGTENLETESEFEQRVLECLQDKGWKVHTQVGCSGYRIDLAVVHPKHEGRYLLGIECDGAMYHSSCVARERDRIREYVLRNLGWDLHRIWSTDWWLNPKREFEKIESRLNENLAKSVSDIVAHQPAPKVIQSLSHTSEPKTKPEPQSTPKEKCFQDQREYKTYKIRGYRSSDFYDEHTTNEICSIIQQIMLDEAPVELNRLIELVRGEWGMARAGAKIRQRIITCINSLNQTIIKERSTQFVYSFPSNPEQKKGFRTPGKNFDFKRTISKIPTFEIENAAESILKENLSLPIDSLINEICSVFGSQRTSESLKKEIFYGIKQKAKEKRWKIEDEQISL